MTLTEQDEPDRLTRAEQEEEDLTDAEMRAGPPVPEVHVCESCGGGGWTATNFGDDDPNPEPCAECDGKGRWTDEGGPDD